MSILTSASCVFPFFLPFYLPSFLPLLTLVFLSGCHVIDFHFNSFWSGHFYLGFPSLCVWQVNFVHCLLPQLGSLSSSSSGVYLHTGCPCVRLCCSGGKEREAQTKLWAAAFVGLAFGFFVQSSKLEFIVPKWDISANTAGDWWGLELNFGQNYSKSLSRCLLFILDPPLPRSYLLFCPEKGGEDRQNPRTLATLLFSRSRTCRHEVASLWAFHVSCHSPHQESVKGGGAAFISRKFLFLAIFFSTAFSCIWMLWHVEVVFCLFVCMVVNLVTFRKTVFNSDIQLWDCYFTGAGKPELIFLPLSIFFSLLPPQLKGVL